MLRHFPTWYLDEIDNIGELAALSLENDEVDDDEETVEAEEDDDMDTEDFAPTGDIGSRR